MPNRTVKEDFREADAENVSDFLNIIAAGASLFAMMSGAGAKSAHEKATTVEDKNKAAKKYNASLTMQLDAAALTIHAEDVGAGIAEIAHTNDFIGTAVSHLESINGIGGVAVSVLPLVYQIVANHAPAEVRDDLPPELMQMGVLPPNMLMERLQAKNAAKMARVQAVILREKQEAEAEVERLREEMDAA